MKTSTIKKILSEIFISLNFKKKGASWIKENEDITKIIQLQKSNFGNYYYLNFGINIKSIYSKSITMHIFNRLGAIDDIHRQEISNLLSIDYNIPENSRKIRLRQYIDELIIAYFESINTEDDVKNSLKKQSSSLNTIPLIVKKHFDL